MRPSENLSAYGGVRGQDGRPKMLARSGFLHVENVFGRQRRHRALQPDAIERVIGIGSKYGNTKGRNTSSNRPFGILSEVPAHLSVIPTEVRRRRTKRRDLATELNKPTDLSFPRSCTSTLDIRIRYSIFFTVLLRLNDC